MDFGLTQGTRPNQNWILYRTWIYKVCLVGYGHVLAEASI